MAQWDLSKWDVLSPGSSAESALAIASRFSEIKQGNIKPQSYDANYREPLAALPDKPLTEDLIRSVVLSHHPANSWGRKNDCMVYQALCKFSGLPIELSDLGEGYKPKPVRSDALPGDAEIEEIWESLASPGWRWIYGMLATYCLKPRKNTGPVCSRDEHPRYQGSTQRIVWGATISASVISEVIDTVREDVKAWQAWPLDEIYPIVYLDALYVNIKVSGRVSKRAVYVALGIDREGEKQLLGLWSGEAETEGAKFWLKVLTDLKNRGLKAILIACCDGLKGFPQAIEAVYPQTQVRLCIVHLMRNCMRYAPEKTERPSPKTSSLYQAANLSRVRGGS